MKNNYNRRENDKQYYENKVWPLTVRNSEMAVAEMLKISTRVYLYSVVYLINNLVNTNNKNYSRLLTRRGR